MKRYFNDEPEPDDFFNDPDDDEEEMFDSPQIVFDQMGSDAELNVLALAIAFVQNGFFAKFKSHKTKLRQVREAYNMFMDLVAGDDLEETDE